MNGETERPSFLRLLIIRMCYHERCGASHFLTTDFHGGVTAIAWPRGELDQPGDLSWKLALEETQIDFCWINDSVTHCMLLELVERRRLESGADLQWDVRGQAWPAFFQLTPDCETVGLVLIGQTLGGFCLVAVFFHLYFCFFLMASCLVVHSYLAKRDFAWSLS